MCHIKFEVGFSPLIFHEVMMLGFRKTLLVSFLQFSFVVLELFSVVGRGIGIVYKTLRTLVFLSSFFNKIHAGQQYLYYENNLVAIGTQKKY
jgi:hypothetical protein